MSFESNKTLGGTGAILLAIPFLNLIGIILVLIAMKGMGEYYNDEDIFKNALYGFIFGFVGVVALIVAIIMYAVGFAAFPPEFPVFSIFGYFIITFLVMYFFSLVAAVFYRQSLNRLAKKSGEQMFGTAGLILLIGAFIPVIGEILKFVAWILAAVGFFNIKKLTEVSESKEPVLSAEERQFCKYCGAPIAPDATFCQRCGKKSD